MIVTSHEHAGRHRVFLDGTDVTENCYRADDEAGIVWCYSRDVNKQLFIDPMTQKPAVSCLKGLVRITKVDRRAA